mmetsp:Transcript_48837/g.110829  ORF Transcript_48837/g.110829 Transcript_48837/m.110829 type:complete len:213 (+) Transcript_48837:435-1073(+)
MRWSSRYPRRRRVKLPPSLRSSPCFLGPRLAKNSRPRSSVCSPRPPNKPTPRTTTLPPRRAARTSSHGSTRTTGCTRVASSWWRPRSACLECKWSCTATTSSWRGARPTPWTRPSSSARTSARCPGRGRPQSRTPGPCGGRGPCSGGPSTSITSRATAGLSRPTRPATWKPRTGTCRCGGARCGWTRALTGVPFGGRTRRRGGRPSGRTSGS